MGSRGSRNFSGISGINSGTFRNKFPEYEMGHSGLSRCLCSLRTRIKICQAAQAHVLLVWTFMQSFLVASPEARRRPHCVHGVYCVPQSVYKSRNDQYGGPPEGRVAPSPSLPAYIPSTSSSGPHTERPFMPVGPLSYGVAFPAPGPALLFVVCRRQSQVSGSRGEGLTDPYP